MCRTIPFLAAPPRSWCLRCSCDCWVAGFFETYTEHFDSRYPTHGSTGAFVLSFAGIGPAALLASLGRYVPRSTSGSNYPFNPIAVPTNSPQFIGKVAFITGAGTGIGRATALAFAREGASVAAAGRTEATLLETVRLIEQAGAGP
jgi:hypothetical protein